MILVQPVCSRVQITLRKTLSIHPFARSSILRRIVSRARYVFFNPNASAIPRSFICFPDFTFTRIERLHSVTPHLSLLLSFISSHILFFSHCFLQIFFRIFYPPIVLLSSERYKRWRFLSFCSSILQYF